MNIGHILKGLAKGATSKSTIGGVVALGAGSLISPALGKAVQDLGGAIASGDKLAIISAGLGAGLILYQSAHQPPQHP